MYELKTCKKCGLEKPVDDFYSGAQTKDGRSSSCKDCVKAAAKARREAKIEYYREYDRERAKLPQRKAYARKYQRSPRGRAAAARYRAKQKAN